MRRDFNQYADWQVTLTRSLENTFKTIYKAVFLPPAHAVIALFQTLAAAALNPPDSKNKSTNPETDLICAIYHTAELQFSTINNQYGQRLESQDF